MKENEKKNKEEAVDDNFIHVQLLYMCAVKISQSTETFFEYTIVNRPVKKNM
jgi:hypothetical protein